MLCCPQDVNTNKSFPVQFCPLPLILDRHRCYAFSISFSEQNHNQITTALNWAKLDTFQAWEICLFRCDCSIGMQHPNMHQITHENSFSQFICYSKIKRQKNAISPNGLYCAHAQGVTWHIWAGEGQRLWNLRQILHPAVELDDIPTDHFYHQKMLSIFICTFSQYTFAYYIDFSTFVIKKTKHLGIHWIDWGKSQNAYQDKWKFSP